MKRCPARTEIVGRLKCEVHDALVSVPRRRGIGIAPRKFLHMAGSNWRAEEEWPTYRILPRNPANAHRISISRPIDAKVSAIPLNNRFTTIYRYIKIHPVKF